MKITLDMEFDSSTRGAIKGGLQIELDDFTGKRVKLILEGPHRHFVVDKDELIQALRAL